MAILLSAQDIYEKDFKSALKGYNTIEVDAFLDDIMKDYESFEKELLVLRQENAELHKRVQELSAQAPKVSTDTAQINTGTTNYDILKRLSHLEKHVFGSKLDTTH